MGAGSGQYTASDDASGNLTCRAPTGSTTCSGTPTGQQLTYDNEGRLTSWQNTATSPSSTDQYLYDGEGHRVEQQMTSSGATTTTVYVGSLESVATTAGATTTTTYYYAAGQRIALAVNGTLSYLASDLLGSASVALDGTDTGLPTASQLYAPYGGVRYSNGVMPTDYGFTGQRTDAATGLDYYGARSYDPAIGQFTSADTVLDGLNRYGYVGGNPISRTDPSGQMSDGFERGGVGMLEGGESSIDLANPVPSAGGGGGIPLPDPGSLLNWILGGATAVEGVLGWLTAIPTAKAPGYSPTAGGVDDSDYWNMRTAPHSTPSASSPGGGTHGGGGHGGSGGGQPQGQPGSDEATAAPEPEPQPSTAGAMQGGGPRDPCDAIVRYLAQCVHTRQMTVFGGRGAGIPCAGSCAIRGTLGGVPVDIELGPYTGVNPVGTHAEVQEYQDVANILLTFAVPGDALTVDFVNAYKPCPAFCQGRIARACARRAEQTW